MYISKKTIILENNQNKKIDAYYIYVNALQYINSMILLYLQYENKLFTTQYLALTKIYAYYSGCFIELDKGYKLEYLSPMFLIIGDYSSNISYLTGADFDKINNRISFTYGICDTTAYEASINIKDWLKFSTISKNNKSQIECDLYIFDIKNDRIMTSFDYCMNIMYEEFSKNDLFIKRKGNILYNEAILQMNIIRKNMIEIKK